MCEKCELAYTPREVRVLITYDQFSPIGILARNITQITKFNFRFEPWHMTSVYISMYGNPSLKIGIYSITDFCSEAGYYIRIYNKYMSGTSKKKCLTILLSPY